MDVITIKTANFKGNITDFLGKSENEISLIAPKPQLEYEGKYFRTLVWLDVCIHKEKEFPIFYKARIYKGGTNSVRFPVGEVFAVGIRSNDYFFYIVRDTKTKEYCFVAKKKPIDDKYLMNWVSRDTNANIINLGVGL